MQLNEGLERLGPKKVNNGLEYEGEVFYGTAIQSIRIPSTMKRLEAGTFADCENLKSVEIPHGVGYIGKNCFYNCRIKKITLPSTLKEIGEDAFKRSNLKTVFVEEGCTLDVRKYIKENVKVRHK